MTQSKVITIRPAGVGKFVDADFKSGICFPKF